MNAVQNAIVIIFCFFYIIIGFFGNIVSILIFTKKIFLIQPTTVYLIASRIHALISLLYLPITVFPTIWNLDDTSCKLFGGIMMIITQIQPWLIAVYSVDRLITSMYPFKFLFKNKFKFQLGLMSTLVFFIIWIIYPIIVFYDKQITEKNISVCSLPVQSGWILIYLKYEYILIKVFLPFFLMILSNILILFEISKNKKQLGLTHLKRKSEIQFGLSIVLNDFIFLILKIPNLIKIITDENGGKYIYDFLYSIYSLIGYLYNVLFFLIFILVNNTYHQLFLKYMRLIKKRIKKIHLRRNNRIAIAVFRNHNDGVVNIIRI